MSTPTLQADEGVLPKVKTTARIFEFVIEPRPAEAPPGTVDEPGWNAATVPDTGPVTVTLYPPTSLSAPRRRSMMELLVEALLPLRERLYAARASREMLKLYWRAADSQPALQGRDLYRQIVVARTGIAADAADALLTRAEESFTTWPTNRALKFADVVHYIAVSEFLAAHGGSPWIHAGFGRVVASRIPHDL